jgi:hypothetical protein
MRRRCHGEKGFDVIEAEPGRLREVTGIGAVRAKQLAHHTNVTAMGAAGGALCEHRVRDCSGVLAVRDQYSIVA